MPNTVDVWDETNDDNDNADSAISLVGSTSSIRTADNNMRAIMGAIARWTGFDTITSATTTDLSTVEGMYVQITGTTTITGLGTAKAGWFKCVEFAGSLTLTHNGSTLILPAGQNITTAAGDCALMVSEGSGAWRCLNYNRTGSPALPVLGTAGQQLQVNSGASGLEYVSGWESLGSSSFSNTAAYALTGLSAYRVIRITGQLVPANDSVLLYVRTDSDGGASYDAGASDYVSQWDYGYGSTSETTSSTTTGFRASGFDVGSDTNEAVQFTIILTEFNQATRCFMNSQVTSIDNAGNFIVQSVGGYRDDTTARDAFQILFSAGNIESGFLSVEGIRG